MRVVILGCGRVGATLAARLERAGHHVTVIDTRSDAFQRLDPDFRGERILGNGVDEDVLRRAGIEEADAFAAVTNGDNRNIMASQIAREIFHTKRVVCRIYDPLREQTYNEMGMETFCPTIIAADTVYDALTDHEADVHV
ncbi:MAG TPA: TrkA family potassium uptake protein [Ktedonobacteraceae bacterium]